MCTPSNKLKKWAFGPKRKLLLGLARAQNPILELFSVYIEIQPLSN